GPGACAVPVVEYPEDALLRGASALWRKIHHTTWGHQHAARREPEAAVDASRSAEYFSRAADGNRQAHESRHSAREVGVSRAATRVARLDPVRIVRARHEAGVRIAGCVSREHRR